MALLIGIATHVGHLWHVVLPIFFIFVVLVVVSWGSHCGCNGMLLVLVSLHEKSYLREEGHIFGSWLQGIQPLYGEGMTARGSWSCCSHTQEVESRECWYSASFSLFHQSWVHGMISHLVRTLKFSYLSNLI